MRLHQGFSGPGFVVKGGIDAAVLDPTTCLRKRLFPANVEGRVFAKQTRLSRIMNVVCSSGADEPRKQGNGEGETWQRSKTSGL